MAESKDVIVDAPVMSEVDETNDIKDVSDKGKETLATIEEADGIVDKVINDAVNTVVDKSNIYIEELKNEYAKLADGIEKNKEEMFDKATDKVFEHLVEQAKSIGVKKSTIATLIKYVMEAVEVTPLKGPEQKDYALRLIRSLVVELANEEDKEYLFIAIDSGSVSDTIDLIVAASRGELNVNIVVDTAATSCMSCLNSIFAKRCKKTRK